MPQQRTEPKGPRHQNSTTRHMVLAALFSALLAVFSQMAVPMVPVPMNLGVLAVFLCALVLTPGWAVISVGLYLLMGLLGLPVFSGFRGGPSVLFGHTGGYLLGYLLMTPLISVLARKTKSFLHRVLVLLTGLFICYLCGTLWLMNLTGRGWAQTLPLAVYSFLPGDGVKILLAASLAPRLRLAFKPRS